jgi:hypothetical protein
MVPFTSLKSTFMALLTVHEPSVSRVTARRVMPPGRSSHAVKR